MSNLATFGKYAAAFEQSLKDNDWSRLERYFCPNSSYLPGDGTQANGRVAVIQALQDSVNALERKCDSRDLLSEPEISEAGDTITLVFKLKYTKRGLPDFILPGCETAQFANGSILNLEDVFDDPSALLDWQNKL